MPGKAKSDIWFFSRQNVEKVRIFFDRRKHRSESHVV